MELNLGGLEQEKGLEKGLSDAKDILSFTHNYKLQLKFRLKFTKQEWFYKR